MTTKKTLLSGIQPSGKMHIGNYFGAIKQFVQYQDTYDSFVFIADLHALTTTQDAAKLKENIIDVALDYLACGLDPAKMTLFKQSDIAGELTFVTWVFNCITTTAYLERAHAFKDANQKAKEVTMGLFDYPMLMAADILVPDADVVPVGQDQKQHVEYARDTAEKFNRIFGDAFRMPEPLIIEDVAVVPGTDGRKMSKSYGNTIPLFGSDEEIKKSVMSIVTDSKGATDPKDPATCNIFALHKLFLDPEEIKELSDQYKKGTVSYKESKEMLLEEVIEFISPMRAEREKLAKDPAIVFEILKKGGEKAKMRAQAKMDLVKEKIGVKLY